MKDLLQVAAQGGSGNAARALGSGLAGLRTGTRRLLVGSAVAVAVIYLGWDLFAGVMGPARTPVPGTAVAATPTVPAESFPAPSLSPSPPPPTIGRPTTVGYSIDIREIAGLAPSTQPGTTIDIWVTWDPPLTKVPKLERVLRGAVIGEIVPPVTPDGPHVAKLSVADRDIESLLWADRYGSLSATTR